MKTKFNGFDIELVLESPQTPMQLMADSICGLTIELPATGAFHYYPIEEGMNTLLFKMDSTTSTPPEISLQVTDEDIRKLKEISVLPIVGF